MTWRRAHQLLALGLAVFWLIQVLTGVLLTFRQEIDNFLAGVAVGFSGYLVSLLATFGVHAPHEIATPLIRSIPSPGGYRFVSGGGVNLIAGAAVLVMAAPLVIGVRQSAAINSCIVALKAAVLIAFVVFGGSAVNWTHFTPFMPPNEGGFAFGWPGVFRAGSVLLGYLAVGAARILFMGPQGYITPEWISQPQWAPTWNYATVQFDVDIEFRPEDNGDALQRLVRKMEAGRRAPWTVEQMGERYESMVGRIVAFRAHVRARTGRFKLGQDESRKSFSEIVAHMEDEALRSWMTEFN
jgi:hypothetical protein